MKAQLDLSVVIVTFNNENEIADCLESLAKELAGDHWQLTVIDNHSQDRTVEILQSAFYRMTGCEAELICNQKNLGFTSALNQGLNKSRGQLLLILNPDTKWQSGSLEALKRVLAHNSKTGVVAPQLLNPDGSVQPSCRRFPLHRDVVFEVFGLSRIFKTSSILNGWKMGDFDHHGQRSVQQPQGACLLFRRDVLDAVGRWDEDFPMFFSDVDWCRRVKAAGFDIVFAPAAKVIHHRGASVFQKRAAMIWSSQRSFYRYFRKHYPRRRLANLLIGWLLLFTAVPRMVIAAIRKVRS
jgi:hypothetical protein